MAKEHKIKYFDIVQIGIYLLSCFYIGVHLFPFV